MIFPHLELEATVQVDDKTRLSASKSFIDKAEAAITLVEIQPSAADSFIDVTGSTADDWYLDWSYATDGAAVVVVRITTDGAPTTFSKTITVISVADDKLFSADSDLTSHESDVLNWVPKGRNSFLDVHRRAQSRILAWLDEHGYTDTSGDRLTKAAVIDIQEMKEWSTFMTLKLIFEGIKNQVDDIFDQKAKTYESLEIGARNRSILRLDLDGDGTAAAGEEKRITTSRLVRV